MTQLAFFFTSPPHPPPHPTRLIPPPYYHLDPGHIILHEQLVVVQQGLAAAHGRFGCVLEGFTPYWNHSGLCVGVCVCKNK